MTTAKEIAAQIEKAMEGVSDHPDEWMVADYCAVCSPANLRVLIDEIKASHVALMIANGEIERLNEALSEVEKERDQLKKDLGSTNAALSICGYGGDTHAGMLAAQKVTMKLAKENLARAEKAEAELAETEKERAEAIAWVADAEDTRRRMEAELAQARKAIDQALTALVNFCAVTDQQEDIHVQLARGNAAIEVCIDALITDTKEGQP